MAGLTVLGSSSVLALLPLTKKVELASFPIFWSAMGLALMFSFFGSPLVALVDSSVLKILGDEKILYGKAMMAVEGKD
jgi:hypothetical protein